MPSRILGCWLSPSARAKRPLPEPPPRPPWPDLGSTLATLPDLGPTLRLPRTLRVGSAAPVASRLRSGRGTGEKRSPIACGSGRRGLCRPRGPRLLGSREPAAKVDFPPDLPDDERRGSRRPEIPLLRAEAASGPRHHGLPQRGPPPNVGRGPASLFRGAPVPRRGRGRLAQSATIGTTSGRGDLECSRPRRARPPPSRPPREDQGKPTHPVGSAAGQSIQISRGLKAPLGPSRIGVFRGRRRILPRAHYAGSRP